MRTDAKIGFAIGGVLLAVLTVYAIVVPKHSKKTSGTVSLVTPVTPSSSDSSSSTPPPFVAADQGGSSQPLPTPPVTVVKDPVVPAPVPAPTPANNAVVDNNNGMTDETHNILPPKDLAKVDDIKPVKLDGDVYIPAGHDRVHPIHAGPSTPLPDDRDPVISSSTGRTYIIKPGQTLSKIAYEVYGNSRFWVAIQRENKGLDAMHLKVGTKINLPDVSPMPGPVTVADEEVIAPPVHIHTAVAITDARSYIVKSGDSLYGIAKRLLGSGGKMDALYALNKDVIGPDESKLKLGMVLKLPQATRSTLAN